MRTCIALLILFSTACKSESKSKPPSNVPEDVVTEAAHEIAKQPRTAMAAKPGFLELTIDLPPSASMPRNAQGYTSWDFKDSKLALVVKEFNGLPTEQAPKGGPMPTSGDKITRKVTEEPGAFVVVDRNDDATGFRLEYCRDLDPAQPPSGVCCEVKLRSASAIVDIDKLISFGEQVCRSLKVSNRKTSPPTGSGSG